jgi:hypothetical protein
MKVKVKDEITGELRRRSEHIANLIKVARVVDALGLAELEVTYAVANTYLGPDELPSITIYPAHVPGIALGIAEEGPTLDIVETAPGLAEIVRLLLPKCGKLDKSYDEQSNQLTVRGTYEGVDIIIHDTPPATCTVESVVEEVEIPARPASVEKRTRYKLVGDCVPLLAHGLVATEPVTAEPTTEVAGG